MSLETWTFSFCNGTLHALFMKFKFQTNVQIFSTSFCATLFRIKFFSRKTYDFLFWEINAWPANIFTICHSYSWPMKSVLHNSVFSCSWICFVFCFHIFSLFYLWYLGWNRNQYLLGHLNICFIFFLQTIRFHESQLFWKKWNENYGVTVPCVEWQFSLTLSLMQILASNYILASRELCLISVTLNI